MHMEMLQFVNAIKMYAKSLSYQIPKSSNSFI